MVDGRVANAEEHRPKVAGGAAPRLYQQVYEIIAGQVSQGVLLPGSRINESSVAEQFGISRAPARQALVELERKGFLDKSAGRGYQVSVSRPGKAAAPVVVPDTAEDLRLTQLSSWEKIYGEVESEIAARCSFAGWRVNETELARFYDVSRTVARDVVGRLQQRGIVRKDERSRWIAPAMTPDHVGELYELRWLLEPVALEKAARKVSAQDLAAMRDHLQSAMDNAADLAGRVGVATDRLRRQATDDADPDPGADHPKRGASGAEVLHRVRSSYSRAGGPGLIWDRGLGCAASVGRLW